MSTLDSTPGRGAYRRFFGANHRAVACDTPHRSHSRPPSPDTRTRPALWRVPRRQARGTRGANRIQKHRTKRSSRSAPCIWLPGDQGIPFRLLPRVSQVRGSNYGLTHNRVAIQISRGKSAGQTTSHASCDLRCSTFLFHVWMSSERAYYPGRIV